MYFSDFSKANDLITKRLLHKRNCLCCEVGVLNKELHTLKNVIRSKQKRLRKMNRDIIHRQTQGSHLTLVCTSGGGNGILANNSVQQKGNDIKLICLQGGGSQCLRGEEIIS